MGGNHNRAHFNEALLGQWLDITVPNIAVASIANPDEIGCEDRAEPANVAHRSALGRCDDILLAGSLTALAVNLNASVGGSRDWPCTPGKVFGQRIIALKIVGKAFAFFQ